MGLKSMLIKSGLFVDTDSVEQGGSTNNPMAASASLEELLAQSPLTSSMATKSIVEMESGGASAALTTSTSLNEVESSLNQVTGVDANQGEKQVKDWQVGVDASFLYQQAQVKDGPYPWERFLKLMEGLAALPDEGKKAAIAAMDAADDSWKVEDIANDMNQKRAVLVKYLDRIRLEVKQEEDLILQKQSESQKESELLLVQWKDEIEALNQKIKEKEREILQSSMQTKSDIEKNQSSAQKEVARVSSWVQTMNQMDNVFFKTKE